MRQFYIKGWIANPIMVDDEDYERVNKYKWYKAGTGIITDKYYGSLKLGRYILNINDPEIKVDHKDRNIFNNQKENLRTCNSSQNNINKEKSVYNTSGYKGVTFYKPTKKWRAQIKFKYKAMHIGYYENLEEAARAYDRAAIKYFGEFAYLNFPDELKNSKL